MIIKLLSSFYFSFFFLQNNQCFRIFQNLNNTFFFQIYLYLILTTSHTSINNQDIK